MPVVLDPDFDFRLQTAGGIEYRLMAGYPKIHQSDDGVSATEVYLMRASDVASFLFESFPLDLMIGGQIIPVRRPMPGAGFLVTKNVDIEPLDEERPMDPFGNDSSAPVNTYNRYAKVTITYEVTKESEEDDPQRDPLKPEEFLEHSFQGTTEAIVVRPEKITHKDAAGTTVESVAPSHADPFIKEVPIVAHTLRWKYVVNPDWDAIIQKLGTLNDRTFTIWRSTDRKYKWDIPKHCLHFSGISGSVKYLFVRNKSGARVIMNPWQLDFQFNERCAYDKVANTGADQRITWRMVWRPKLGWTVVTMGRASDIYLYTESDFRKLFVPQGVNYGVT
jgi:hypothetical protein